jgi:hypothetical protein
LTRRLIPVTRKAVFRWILRWAFRSAVVLVLLLILAGLWWMRQGLYHRWVRFPREARAWQAIRQDRQAVTVKTGWTEYRGIIHSHSHWSHDCEVKFEDILEVMRTTGRDFICLSDHCVDGRADFNLQWRGIHDGRLFIPGFEMKAGIMPFGVNAGIVLSNSTEARLLARQIVTQGGALFYAHPEEPRDWELPELHGMEIYNVHADLKDEPHGLSALLPDIWLNLNRYPDHVVRLIFDRPTANLKRWDRSNRSRHLAGIAGNDCHQNTGVRFFYTSADTLRIEDTSPETLAEYRLNFVTRTLLRCLFGRLQTERPLCHLQLDPYERMTRFVATHVLARDLTEPAILESLKQGRAFVGFDMLADSTGFLWWAEGAGERSVMGETLPFAPGLRLRAAAPHTARFTVVRNGEHVCQGIGRTLEYAPPGPGTYRVEAELSILGKWVPWIYANPIWLQ